MGGNNLSLWLGLLAWIGLAKVPKYVEDQSSCSHTVRRPCDHVDVAKKMNVSGYNMMKLSKKSCEEINCRERAVVSNFQQNRKKKTPKWGPLKCSSTLLNNCAHCAWIQANRWWQTWTGTTDIVRYSEELLIHINRPTPIDLQQVRKRLFFLSKVEFAAVGTFFLTNRFLFLRIFVSM